MNRHAKASPAGSPTRQKGRLKLLVASVAILALALALGVGVASAVAPVVSIENAEDVAYTTATVKGTVDAEDHETSYHFEYATQADFSDATQFGAGTLPAGEPAEPASPVTEQLSGLKPETAYFLRLVAENTEGERDEAEAASFETEAVARPIVGTPAVSAQTGHSAHFEATVNPDAPKANGELSQAAKDAYRTHWWFTCVPGCDFSASSEGEGFIEADADPLNAANAVSAAAAGLQANLSNKVTLHAANAGGEVAKEASFSTTLVGPEVNPAPVGAYDPTSTTATIKGKVNPENSKVSECHFVYGVGTPSGNTAPCDPPHPAIDETQKITVKASSGQFKLSFESESTPDLPFNASPAAVQSALEGLASIGAGNVKVSGGPGGPDGPDSPNVPAPYVVAFVEDLSATNLPEIQAENGTTPLGGKVEAATTEAGGGAQNNHQKITVSATGGQFKLTFEGQTTSDISFVAKPPVVQAALEGLSSIGAGNVAVSGGPDGHLPYFITFQGALAKTDVGQITAASGTQPLLGGVDVSAFHQDGSLSSPVDVSAALTGLQPDTEYRFKVIATNAGGTEESDEQYFITPSAPQPDGTCPNEAIRQEQRFFPAECRAFEMVSPQVKTGANVVGEATNVAAAADGNGAFFTSRGGFAGTTGAGRTGFTQYLARRGADGWNTKAITPTPSGDSAQVFNGGTEFFFFDENLHKATLWGFDLPEREDDIAHNDNIYRMDTDSQTLETVTLSAQQEGGIGFGDFNGQGETWGASADTGVISFASKTKLLPEAAPGARNTYEWDHGTLRLAGILPGDTKAPVGGSTPPRFPEQDGYRATVSSDGSRLIFATPAEGGNKQLYMRRNHTDTVWITEPEVSGFSGQPQNVELRWVSPDAHKVLFTTTSSLVSDDEGEGEDVYLYTDGPDSAVEGSNLKIISPISDRYEVFGASDDASRIYFVGGAGELRVWDHGEVRSIYPIPDALTPGAGYDVMASPGNSRVSADGRFVAVRSGDAQMHVYDAVDNTLACASCATDGPTTGTVPRQPQVNLTQVEKPIAQLRPRYLSDDGSKVFFSTTTALVPGDTNEVMDTYVYDTRTGEQRLLSSGKGEEGEWFVNASASGNDAFFITNQALLARDPDQLADLYDSRVGGGFVEPPPPPTVCVGDGCRGALSSPPGGSSPSTASFSGPGNPHPKKAKKPPKKKRHHRAKRHSHKGARR